MKISVLLPVYKESEQYLGEAIDSILSQTYRNFELLIIIDTGQDNPEFERIYNYVKKKSQQDRRIRVIINTQNLGQPKSLNRAILESKGEYIAIMNADDIAIPERLEEQLKFLKNNKDYDICGTQVIYIGARGEELGRSKILSEIEIIRRLYSAHSPIFHPTWFAKKSLFIELNGYRELSPTEDYDLLCRAFLRGKKLTQINKPLLKYRIHINPTRLTTKSRALQDCLAIEIAKALQRNEDFSECLFSQCVKKANSCGIAKILDQISLHFERVTQVNFPKFYNTLKWGIFMLSPFKAKHLLFTIYSRIKFRFHRRYNSNLRLEF